MVRDDRLLYARISGATWRELGQRFEISHEGARFIYHRARENYLDALERAVGHGVATDGAWELATPPPFRNDPDLAARYAAWVIGALAERGIYLTTATFGLKEAAR